MELSTSTAGVVSVLVLVGALALAHRPLGDHIARVLTSERHLAIERAVYARPGSTQGPTSGGARTPCRCWASRSPRCCCSTSCCGCSSGSRSLWGSRGSRRGRLQHRGLVRHEHELAVLLRRVDDGPPRRRWPAWRCRTSSPPRSASRSPSPWSAASPARRTDRLGNFWVDLVRGCVRILLPLSLVAALVLVLAGRRAEPSAATDVTTLAGGTQTLAGGPVASQEAIKELGTNGGGFFNANSAHPFENPTPFTNLFEIFLLLVIPFSLPRTFGRMVGDARQGYAMLATMAVLWLGSGRGHDRAASCAGRGTVPQAAGAAMEGKEVRFGIPASALFAASTTRHLDRRGELLPRLVHRRSAAGSRCST